MIIDMLRKKGLSENDRIIVGILSGCAMAGFSTIFSALLLAVTYLWGWIGFTSLIGVCLLGCLAVIFCGDDE